MNVTTWGALLFIGRKTTSKGDILAHRVWHTDWCWNRTTSLKLLQLHKVCYEEIDRPQVAIKYIAVTSENARRHRDNTQSPHSKALDLGCKPATFLQRRNSSNHCRALSIVKVILTQDASGVKTHCRQTLKSCAFFKCLSLIWFFFKFVFLFPYVLAAQHVLKSKAKPDFQFLHTL